MTNAVEKTSKTTIGPLDWRRRITPVGGAAVVGTLLAHLVWRPLSGIEPIILFGHLALDETVGILAGLAVGLWVVLSPGETKAG